MTDQLRLGTLGDTVLQAGPSVPIPGPLFEAGPSVPLGDPLSGADPASLDGGIGFPIP